MTKTGMETFMKPGGRIEADVTMRRKAGAENGTTVMTVRSTTALTKWKDINPKRKNPLILTINDQHMAKHAAKPLAILEIKSTDGRFSAEVLLKKKGAGTSGNNFGIPVSMIEKGMDWILENLSDGRVIRMQNRQGEYIDYTISSLKEIGLFQTGLPGRKKFYSC